jgi:predicted aconitase
VPLVLGLQALAPDSDALKAFGAAFATTSAAPLFHIAGVTPEAPTAQRWRPAHGIPADHPGGPDAPGASWTSARDPRATGVAGQPALFPWRVRSPGALVPGRRKHPDVVLAITCGRAVLEQAREAGHIAVIEAFGATLVTDTCWCMLGEPVIPPAATTLMTNSGKYAHYAPGLVGRKVHFASLAECVDAACSATASGRLPAWLQPAAQLESPAHV